MDEVPVGRKKVYLHEVSRIYSLALTINANPQAEVVSKEENPDIIVVAWEVGGWGIRSEVAKALSQSNAPIIFVFTQVNPDNAVLRDEELDELSQSILEPYFSQKKYELIRLAFNTDAGRQQFDAALKRVIQEIESANQLPVVAAVSQSTPAFFAYAHAHDASMKHSRQVRHKYAEEHLRFDVNEAPDVRMKKVVLLFAHYISIKDLKSTLSETMEAILAEELNYPDYQATHTIDRATFFGKNKDRVAIELRRLLLGKYGDISNDFLNVLINQLRPVDSLETSVFYKSNAAEISRLIEAAELFYDKKAQAKVARREESDLTDQAERDLSFEVEHGFSFYGPTGHPVNVASYRTRLGMLDDKWTPKGHEIKNYTPYQLMMVFAHYMSAEAKTPLSKFLEDKLASALFNGVEYFDYQRKEKSKEEIARQLRDKIDAKIVEANDDGVRRAWGYVELFIRLLECATRVEGKIRGDIKLLPVKLERSAVLEKRVEDTITLVDKVCNYLLENPALENIVNLMDGLDLPDDAKDLIRRVEAMPRLG